MGSGAFGLHESDGLYFALEDEEAVVVQIDALLTQEDRNLFVVGGLVVQVVSALRGGNKAEFSFSMKRVTAQ